MDTLNTAARILLLCLYHAHKAIMDGKVGTFDAGTSTLCGGLLLPIVSENNNIDTTDIQWCFLSVNLGDCKAYIISPSSRKLVEITTGVRTMGALSARDCGGRLGPQLSHGAPDLRNLEVRYSNCVKGDFILLMTDGVHDNFDPEFLGYLVSEINPEINSSWEDLAPAVSNTIRAEFTYKKLCEIIFSDNILTSETIIEKLLHYSFDITKCGRETMERTGGIKLPNDYKSFPGKMDHATCVCLEVGIYPTLK